MSKYWSIRSRVDALPLYAFAPSKDEALRVVETLIGPLNPSHRAITALAECPEGYQAGGPLPHILDPDEDWSAE
jgi:hypothetical protein